mmetsp:Transcript_1545/g.3743  ORF Transcript_1545/g.3743 Transcript_1545/m.3743 type:complete len:253 (+) Transcript_1545:142-900(+)
MPRALGGPRGVGVSYERGTPVGRGLEASEDGAGARAYRARKRRRIVASAAGWSSWIAWPPWSTSSWNPPCICPTTSVVSRLSREDSTRSFGMRDGTARNADDMPLNQPSQCGADPSTSARHFTPPLPSSTTMHGMLNSADSREWRSLESSAHVTASATHGNDLGRRRSPAIERPNAATAVPSLVSRTTSARTTNPASSKTVTLRTATLPPIECPTKTSGGRESPSTARRTRRRSDTRRSRLRSPSSEAREAP